MTNKEQEFISDLIKAEQIFLNGLIQPLAGNLFSSGGGGMPALLSLNNLN